MTNRFPSNALRVASLALFFLPVGCNSSAAPALPVPAQTGEAVQEVLEPASERPDYQPGMSPFATRLDSGELVRFAVSVPPGYSKERPSPLVLSLHYGGEMTPYYGGGMVQLLVEPGLRDLDAIIVAPDSLGGPWSSELNEKAVLEVLKLVRKNLHTDPHRTLVIGYSRGGRGTWEFGAKHQDQFAAAIPMSARPPATPAAWKIPLYVIHSRDDGGIDVESVEEHVDRLKQQGADVTLRVVAGITHFETARFVEPLREAVPWIRKVWDAASER